VERLLAEIESVSRQKDERQDLEMNDTVAVDVELTQINSDVDIDIKATFGQTGEKRESMRGLTPWRTALLRNMCRWRFSKRWER